MPNRLLIAACLLALARPAQAQRVNSILNPSPSRATTALPLQSPSDTALHYGAMALAGAVGVVGGAYGGVVLGAAAERGISGGCRGEWGCFGGAVIGFLIGEPTAPALAVHLANHGRGALGTEVAANIGILIAGIILGSHVQGGSDGAWLIGVPVAQIAASIAIEQATSAH